MPSRKRSADPSLQPSMPHTSAIGQSTHIFAEPASITVPEFMTFPVERQSKRVAAHGHKCCQMHERDGGVFGCELPSGHAWPHALEALDSLRPNRFRQERSQKEMKAIMLCAPKMKQPELMNDGEDTSDEATIISIGDATKLSSRRTSPVTAPSTPTIMSSFISSDAAEDKTDEVELFDFFELDAAPLVMEAKRSSANAVEGRILRTPSSCPFLERAFTLERAFEGVNEPAEEAVMLDIIISFEDEILDEIGPDLRTVWDAASQPATIESSLLWDVVATPAMMRRHAVHTRKVKVKEAAEAACAAGGVFCAADDDARHFSE